MPNNYDFKEDSFSFRAVQYANSIISGEKPACKYVIDACKRFIADLKRNDIVLTENAEKWCGFLQKLPHTKGKWASKKELFLLSDWQVFATVNIYGWYWVDSGRRRFREALILVPRKNGKSFYVAGLGLGHLCIDGEFGAEVYCGATSEKQAWEVFRPAKQICERESDLREHFGLTVNAKSLTILDNGSRFEPVIGNPGDGSSPLCAIADEFHEHPTSDQVDTFITGMGARDNPMMLYVTTAGSDIGGPCYAKMQDVIKILDGTYNDDTIFGLIYTIDDNDRWDTIDAQKKANPNYGVSVDSDFLAGQLAQAKRSATKQTSYKTKHLNQWVGAKAAWMNMLAYQKCRKKINITDFYGRQAFAGMDLASKLDIASIAIVFPPLNPGEKWGVFVKNYIPEERITEGGNTRYKAWHADGWLTATPGDVTDYDYIRHDLDELKSLIEIREVAFDPFQATYFVTRMQEDGYTMVEVGATVKNFSQPMKEIESFIIDGNIEFEKDPVLMWMFGNVVAKLDLKDNIFPNKERKENKIDGVVAVIMAVNRALRYLGDDGTSIYDEQDLLLF